MKSKISLVTLGVKDIKKSLLFYRDGLGLITHNYKDGDEAIFFEMDGSWLSIYPKDKLAQDATVANDGSGFTGVTLAHNVKSKEEVNEVVDQAVTAGAKLIKKPQQVFWGGYSGYFADPDGYLWEVAFNPFTDLS